MPAAEDPTIRTELLKIYFGLFNKLLHYMPPEVKQQTLDELKQKLKKDRTISKQARQAELKKLTKRRGTDLDEEDNKVIELVLKGINHILLKAADAKELHTIIQEQSDMLFKLTHHKVFKIQMQVLMLLFQFSKVSHKLKNVTVEGEKTSFADRFYRTLYEVILKVSSTKAQKLDDFFGLMFKAMRADPDIARVIAFVRRLLQMTFCNEASFTCACLLVVNEVFRSRSDIRYAVF